jgi:hypothetical protein
VALEDAVRWLFEWVEADSPRLWIFVAVCVVAIFMWAVANLMDLGWEFGLSTVPGLLVAAHSGFFLGLATFSLVFLGLWIYLGRSARIRPSPLESVSAK